MDPVLDGLNAAQRAAVTSPASILQVLAPPGSGKTKTLTARVAYLLSHHGYRPQDVICCTFTIKASREMRERIAKLIGDQLESKLILGTFHSICRRYLMAYGHLIGLQKGFGIADSNDSLAIIKVWRRLSRCFFFFFFGALVEEYCLFLFSMAENREAVTTKHPAQHGAVEDLDSKSARCQP